MSIPEATSGVEIKSFTGLVTNADEDATPDGSAKIQVNATLITPGEVHVRKGMRQVTFTETQV